MCRPFSWHRFTHLGVPLTLLQPVEKARSYGGLVSKCRNGGVDRGPRHVGHPAVLANDLRSGPWNVYGAIRVPRETGTGCGSLSWFPPLRPDDLHRLRSVRKGLSGRLHLHWQGARQRGARAFASRVMPSTTRNACFVRCVSNLVPVDCIFMGATHDLSCYSRDGCIVDFSRLPLDIAWGRSTLNPTAVAESKLIAEPVHGGPNQ